MTTQISPSPIRQQTRGSGLARTVWLVAGVCWVVTVAAIALGAHAHGHHDAALGTDGSTWWRLAAFAGAWTVMVGAMMLPSAIPMLELFWAASARQRRPAQARAAMIIPYFLVWLGFGGLALAGDAVIHRLVDLWGWLAARPDLILGAVLMLAGAFQFTALKKACLTGCRSPVGMLWEYYGQGLRPAWRLGLRHALLCLGCCWALMLVMFATGTGGLGWMLLLTAVMVAEKTTAWGARLVTPTGVAFIASGLLVLLAAATTAPAQDPTGHAGHGGLGAPDLSLIGLLLTTLMLGVWAAYAHAGGPASGAGAGDQAGQR